MRIKKIKSLFFCFIILLIIILVFDFLPFKANEGILRILSDSIGNIGGTGVAALFFILITHETQLKKMIFIAIMSAMGLIAYEFLQFILPWQVYDRQDILGTLIGLLLIVFIILFNHFILYKRVNKTI